MNMKKILAALLALLMILSLAACGATEPEAPTETPETSAPSEESPVPPEEDVPDPEEPEASGDVDAKLTEVHTALKDAYGEDYIPSMPLDATMMAEVYGINMDNVESFIGEAPMMSAHVDTFIAIKAKEGKADAVEADLNAYRDNVVNNSMNYPMNEDKVNASQVVRKGDYVFYMMLGGFADENTKDPVQFAKDEMQIGLDKLEELFK